MRNHIIVGGAIVVAIILGVLAFLYSDKASNALSSAVAENSIVPVAVPFTEIAHGTRSTVSTRTNYLITSTDQLTKLWAMIDATGTPPSIDFSKGAIIAVFMGNASSTLAIAVTKIEDGPAARGVFIMLTESACAVKQKNAAPYEIISVPATTLPMTHEDTITTTSCPKN